MSHRALSLIVMFATACAVGGCGSDATHQAPDGGDTGADTDTYSDGDADSETDFDGDTDEDGLSDDFEEEIGTDPFDPDSDDDGVSDFVEWVAGTDPNDPDSNPMAEGDFYFVSPYLTPPLPETAVLVFTTGEAAAELAAALRDDESDERDATALLERVSPNTEGGVADPTNPELICAGGLATADDDSDSIPDRFVDVAADTTVCFDVISAMNETIAPNSHATIWKAFIDIVGGEAAALDTRTVYFVVPPSVLD